MSEVSAINVLLMTFVFLGCLPLVVSLYQFLMIGVHSFKNHYHQTACYFPRVSILVPAWNEANVLDSTIESLMDMSYPKEMLRIYIIDDASTDKTPELMQQKMNKYSLNVFHIRRLKGGEGKAHTLNHGIKEILSESWSEAFLIMDADVLFEKMH